MPPKKVAKEKPVEAHVHNETERWKKGEWENKVQPMVAGGPAWYAGNSINSTGGVTIVTPSTSSSTFTYSSLTGAH